MAGLGGEAAPCRSYHLWHIISLRTPRCPADEPEAHQSDPRPTPPAPHALISCAPPCPAQVEYLEFLEIMTTTLQRLAEEREADEAHAGEGQVPFALMATAYRRKRLMEGIISGDKEVMSQIAQLSEKQNQEAAAAAASAASAAARKAAAAAKSPETQKILTSITKRSLARLQSMHVDTELLAELSPEERRLLSSVAAKAVKQGVVGNRSPSPSPQMQAQFPVGGLIRRGGSPPLPPAMGRSPSQAQLGLGAGAHSMSPVRPRANGISNSGTGKLPLVPNSKLVHYSHTPGHQQLMEVPQVFDLRFSRSTIKLPVGASGSRSAVSLSPSQAGPVGGGGGGGLPPLGPRSGIASGTSYGSEPTTYHRASSSLQ